MRRGLLTFSLLSLGLGVAGCASPPPEPVAAVTQELSAAKRVERLTAIRDTAAEMGLYNAALIGGIAISETQLAHCQSEATYACKGPASASCGGGPIIAGSADGPCADMQGGLGMFQFDAGTYGQTIATYGNDVLTVGGNSALAVNFVVDKTILDIAGVTDWRSSMAWINAVPMSATDPLMNEWASLLACRYNGCCSSSQLCITRANGYRDHAIEAYQETGAEFWRTSAWCTKLPEDGIIDQRTACYLAGGDPRYWRREASGYGDDAEWAMTTDAAAPENYAEWLVKTERASTFRVEVHLDGGTIGQSTRASYSIVHAGETDVVVIDQTATSGWALLGDYPFAGTGDERVFLGDNTGEAGPGKLLFDAIRVTPLDAGSGGGDDDGGGGGGCTAGGGPGLLLTLLGLLVARRRRHRRSA